MFAAITYKQKNALLIVFAVLLIFLIYSFAIKRTIQSYSDYQDLKDKVELASSAFSSVDYFKKEIKKMDVKMNITTNQIYSEDILLDIVSNYCQRNNLVLREFPQSTTCTNGNIIIETNYFVVEGGFNALLKLIYLLEQKMKFGKVASVHYQYKRDMKTKEMALTSAIYIQNIKK